MWSSASCRCRKVGTSGCNQSADRSAGRPVDDISDLHWHGSDDNVSGAVRSQTHNKAEDDDDERKKKQRSGE